jgi:hypothetical protein
LKIDQETENSQGPTRAVEPFKRKKNQIMVSMHIIKIITAFPYIFITSKSNKILGDHLRRVTIFLVDGDVSEILKFVMM